MKIYTIGFTKKTARQFFELLEKNRIECLVDIRLRPDSQLAGFAKQVDLKYFLERLINCDYRYLSTLAPTAEILDMYRKDKDWKKYEVAFQELMDLRGIPDTLDKALFEEKTCCLLCSESTSEKCHRRLVVERIAAKWVGVEIVHL
jgi:uncharacterized protein (DUF488 family)